MTPGPDSRAAPRRGAIVAIAVGAAAVDSALLGVFAPLGGRWGDRSGRRGPAVAGLAATALSALLLAALPGVAGTTVALGVYGAGFSLSLTAATPWLDEAFGERERGLAYGVLNLLYAGGYAIGPVLGGLVLELADADLAYAITAAALAVGTATLLVVSRGDRAEPGAA